MSFEKEYYESPEFWADGMIADNSNRIRVNETIDMIPAEVYTLLDVGCGNGVFPNSLSKLRATIKVTATDRSREALKYVRTEKFESDISDIPVESGSFDCVTCLQVIEHLPDHLYNISLSELARVAKKYLIISIPFNEDLEKSFTKCPKCLSRFNPDLHFRNFNLETMTHLFSSHGFKLKTSKNVVKYDKFWGVEYYSKIRSHFSPPEKPVFNSPICPVCGYRNMTFSTAKPANQKEAGKAPGIKSVLRKIWPKVKVSGYWLIALYERT